MRRNVGKGDHFRKIALERGALVRIQMGCREIEPVRSWIALDEGTSLLLSFEHTRVDLRLGGPTRLAMVRGCVGKLVLVIALFIREIELPVLRMSALSRAGLVRVGMRQVSSDRMGILRRLDLVYVAALGLRALLGLIVRIGFLVVRRRIAGLVAVRQHALSRSGLDRRFASGSATPVLRDDNWTWRVGFSAVRLLGATRYDLVVRGDGRVEATDIRLIGWLVGMARRDRAHRLIRQWNALVGSTLVGFRRASLAAMRHVHGEPVVATAAGRAAGRGGGGAGELEGGVLLAGMRLNARERSLAPGLEIRATVDRTRQGRVASHSDVDSASTAGNPAGGPNSHVVLLVNVNVCKHPVLGDVIGSSGDALLHPLARRTAVVAPDRAKSGVGRDIRLIDVDLVRPSLDIQVAVDLAGDPALGGDVRALER